MTANVSRQVKADRESRLQFARQAASVSILLRGVFGRCSSLPCSGNACHQDSRTLHMAAVQTGWPARGFKFLRVAASESEADRRRARSRHRCNGPPPRQGSSDVSLARFLSLPGIAVLQQRRALDLVRSELDRQLVRGKYLYSFRGTGEPATANVTLAVHLRRRFGLELPEFGTDDSPESYS